MEVTDQWVLTPSSQLSHAYSPSSLCIPNDNLFGPSSNCFFDFTIRFKQSILSLIPSLLLLVFAPPRIFYLYKQGGEKKSIRHPIAIVKLVSIYFVADKAQFLIRCIKVLTILLSLSQLALLLLCTQDPSGNIASIPSTTLALFSAVEIIVLSHLEHGHSITPSFLLNVYLLFSILLDAAQIRSLVLRSGNVFILATFSVTVGLKGILLVLEAQNRLPYLKAE